MADETHRHTYVLRGDSGHLERSLSRTTKAMSENEKQSKRTARGVDNLSVSLRLLVAGAGLVGASMKAASTATLLAGGGFLKLANHVAETHRQLAELSARGGLSVEILNGLRVAAIKTGSDFDQMVPDDFGERMLDAATDVGEAAEGFRALGIKVTESDGTLRNINTVLLETVSELQGIADDGTRAGLSMLTLGENGGRTMAALRGRELQDFVDLAGKFGFDTGPAAAKQAEDWAQAVGSVRLAAENVGDAFNDTVGPAATQFVDNLALGMIFLSELVKESADDFTGLGQILSGLAQADIRDGIDDIREGWQLLRGDTNDLEGAMAAALERAREFWKAQQDGAEFVGPTLDMIEDGIGNIKKALEGNKKEVDALAAAEKRLADIARTASDDQLEGIDEVNAKYRERFFLIAELGKTGADTAEAIAATEKALAAEIEAATQKIYSDRIKAAKEANDELADGASDAFGDMVDALQGVGDQLDELKSKQQESLQGWLAMAGAASDAFTDISNGYSDIVQAQLESTLELQGEEGDVLDERKQKMKDLRAEARAEEQAGNAARAMELRDQANSIAGKNKERRASLEAIEEELAAKHKASVAAFHIGQAAAIASIVADSFATAAALTLALAPVLGPAAPFVAGGLAAASAAGQIASVQTNKPPEKPPSVLHDGGVLAPDEFNFGGSVLRAGEQGVVLNQRASEQGGLQVLDSLNRGTGGGGTTVLQLVDSGVVIGEALLHSANGSSQTSRDVRAALNGNVPTR